MKRTGTCPKCQSSEVVVVEPVTDQVGEGSFGLAQDAYICTSCGLIEFHARDIEAVVRAGRAHRPKSPYR